MLCWFMKQWYYAQQPSPPDSCLKFLLKYILCSLPVGWLQILHPQAFSSLSSHESQVHLQVDSSRVLMGLCHWASYWWAALCHFLAQISSWMDVIFSPVECPSHSCITSWLSLSLKKCSNFPPILFAFSYWSMFFFFHDFFRFDVCMCAYLCVCMCLCAFSCLHAHLHMCMCLWICV